MDSSKGKHLLPYLLVMKVGAKPDDEAVYVQGVIDMVKREYDLNPEEVTVRMRSETGLITGEKAVMTAINELGLVGDVSDVEFHFGEFSDSEDDGGRYVVVQAKK